MSLRIGALAAALTALLVGVAPAHAGSGFSSGCFDGGGAEVPIMVTPWTIGAEVTQVSNGTRVDICFATSPVGYTGSQLTGGRISILNFTGGGTSVQCWSDFSNTVTPYCQGTAAATSDGSAAIVIVNFAGADTSATSPVVIGTTGVVVFSPVAFGPTPPCVLVNGTHLVPICGSPIV